MIISITTKTAYYENLWEQLEELTKEYQLVYKTVNSLKKERKISAYLNNKLTYFDSRINSVLNKFN